MKWDSAPGLSDAVRSRDSTSVTPRHAPSDKIQQVNGLRVREDLPYPLLGTPQNPERTWDSHRAWDRVQVSTT